VLWLATANQLSQDVAPVPFLWIVPLALYLLSFVLCFDSSRWYRQRVFRWVLPAAWIGIIAVVAQQGYVNIKISVVVLNAALFLCCMFCHGELARLRPASRQLTSYYVTISAGGAAGGVFVGLIAPRVFTDYFELPLGMVLCIVLALWLLYSLSSKRVLRVGLTVGAAAVAAIAFQPSDVKNEVAIRNFYGTLKVGEFGAADKVFRALYNGTIQHGVQYMNPKYRAVPTTYYGPASGASMALHSLMKQGPVHVGVIGLGVGTMAAYARPGDHYRFYEVNPDVVRLANASFLYLKESKGSSAVAAGDARVSLEREPSQQFDLLVVDAFSGDSIPVHLLTREAMELYFRHIKPSGAIAVHTTNKHLELPPVVQSVASSLGASSILIHNDKRVDFNIHYSSWVIVTKDKTLQSELGWLGSRIKRNPRLRLWTDDYSNLLFILQ
jgi:spermidine synthase